MGTGGSARRRQGGGSVDSAEAIRVLGQLGQRSTLFRWLFDHYDGNSTRDWGRRPGVPWAQYCGYLEGLGLTLAGGERITPRGAAQTWYRLRKEKARLAALEAAEEAAREARRQEQEEAAAVRYAAACCQSAASRAADDAPSGSVSSRCVGRPCGGGRRGTHGSHAGRVGQPFGEQDDAIRSADAGRPAADRRLGGKARVGGFYGRARGRAVRSAADD